MHKQVRKKSLLINDHQRPAIWLTIWKSLSSVCSQSPWFCWLFALTWVWKYHSYDGQPPFLLWEILTIALSKWFLTPPHFFLPLDNLTHWHVTHKTDVLIKYKTGLSAIKIKWLFPPLFRWLTQILHPSHAFISSALWGNVKNEICCPKLKETMVLMESLEKLFQNAASFQK